MAKYDLPSERWNLSAILDWIMFRSPYRIWVLAQYPDAAADWPYFSDKRIAPTEPIEPEPEEGPKHRRLTALTPKPLTDLLKALKNARTGESDGEIRPI